MAKWALLFGIGLGSSPLFATPPLFYQTLFSDSEWRSGAPLIEKNWLGDFENPLTTPPKKAYSIKSYQKSKDLKAALLSNPLPPPEPDRIQAILRKHHLLQDPRFQGLKEDLPELIREAFLLEAWLLDHPKDLRGHYAYLLTLKAIEADAFLNVKFFTDQEGLPLKDWLDKLPDAPPKDLVTTLYLVSAKTLEELLKELISYHPKDPTFPLMLARSYHRQGRHQKAIDTYLKLEASHPLEPIDQKRFLQSLAYGPKPNPFPKFYPSYAPHFLEQEGQALKDRYDLDLQARAFLKEPKDRQTPQKWLAIAEGYQQKNLFVPLKEFMAQSPEGVLLQKEFFALKLAVAREDLNQKSLGGFVTSLLNLDYGPSWLKTIAHEIETYESVLKEAKDHHGLAQEFFEHALWLHGIRGLKMFFQTVVATETDSPKKLEDWFQKELDRSLAFIQKLDPKKLRDSQKRLLELFTAILQDLRQSLTDQSLAQLWQKESPLPEDQLQKLWETMNTSVMALVRYFDESFHAPWTDELLSLASDPDAPKHLYRFLKEWEQSFDAKKPLTILNRFTKLLITHKSTLHRILSGVEEEQQLDQIFQVIDLVFTLTSEWQAYPDDKLEFFWQLPISPKLFEGLREFLETFFTPLHKAYYRAQLLYLAYLKTHDRQQIQKACSETLSAVTLLAKTPLLEPTPWLSLLPDDLESILNQNLGYCLAMQNHPDAHLFAKSARLQNHDEEKNIRFIFNHYFASYGDHPKTMLLAVKELHASVKEDPDLPPPLKDRYLKETKRWLSYYQGLDSKTNAPFEPSAISGGSLYMSLEKSHTKGIKAKLAVSQFFFLDPMLPLAH